MLHRHITPHKLTLAAIDDIIARGSLDHWRQMRSAALADRLVMERIERVARAGAVDPYAQRHWFWMHYVKKHRASP